MGSTVDSFERAAVQTLAPAQATSIWAEDRGRRGKITKREVLITGAVAVRATVAVVLFIALSKSSEGSSLGAFAQASDPNSLGCFADERDDRVFPYVFRDETGMAPTVSAAAKLRGQNSTLCTIDVRRIGALHSAAHERRAFYCCCC